MKSYIAILLLALSSHAISKSYVEPYIGSSNGSGKSKYTSTDYAHKYSGRLIGVRAGWVSKSKLFYALDYSINQFILDSESSGSYADDEVSKSQLGLLVGRSFGAVKLWATYFLQGKLQGEDSASTGQFLSDDQSFKNLSGVGIGASFFIFAKTQLNIEYRSLDYSKSISSGSSVASFDRSNMSEYIVAVSFPFGGGK
ncbi:hypothetical protein N9B72_02275 [Bacteriovoracaceae bacterium]|nr:hypothetical protein [Bacteriovoracaceae bacterium]